MAIARSLVTAFGDGEIERFTRLKAFPNHVKYRDGDKALFGDTSNPTPARYSTKPPVKVVKVLESEESRRMSSM